ncbi:MAG: hypothetical protein U1E20_04085 [Methylocystis sp.]|uniref:hypothetical protein n=1 Tax=Methylocystis sp. TaxID=1911079 RepID=UPI00394B4E03
MIESALLRPATLAFAIVGFAAAIAPAAAASRAERAQARYSEFYALAPSATDSGAATRHAGDCFQTNSPVEAARGIRHWTGACAGGH